MLTQFIANLESLEDKRMAHLPLMSSVIYPLAVVLAYTAFVLHTGRAIMQNRRAFRLNGALRAYNVMQMALNAFVFFKALRHMDRMRVHCIEWDASNSPESLDYLQIHYYYMLLKFFDLLDTIFFVLRKKNKQITFLHVYHHIMMTWTAWVSCKYNPGGLSYYPILVNTFVHFIMYYYYYLANKNKSQDIWWKKYITVVQLIQNTFVTYISFAHAFNPYCSYSKPMALWYAVNAFALFYLFMEFYVKSYLKQSK